MTRSVATFLGTAATVLSLSSTTAHAETVVLPVRPVALTITPNYARHVEQHPEIRRAIADLEQARYTMQHAAHDFGGHRVDAIRACDNAIAQLRLALQFDR